MWAVISSMVHDAPYLLHRHCSRAKLLGFDPAPTLFRYELHTPCGPSLNDGQLRGPIDRVNPAIGAHKATEGWKLIPAFAGAADLKDKLQAGTSNPYLPDGCLTYDERYLQYRDDFFFANR